MTVTDRAHAGIACAGMLAGLLLTGARLSPLYRKYSIISTYLLDLSIPSTYAENMSNSVNMPWAPEQPFNGLPLLPPKAELETRAVLKACITARGALAELKQAAALGRRCATERLYMKAGKHSPGDPSTPARRSLYARVSDRLI